jgi:hypothetical protein
MDFFKRFTNLLTPPPEKDSATSHNSTIESPDAETNALTANLGQTVKSLVTAPGLEHPQATEAIATLKKIAAASGLYVVASKMRYQLDAMPRALASGAVNWKDRGYLLAADFIYEHIARDVRAIESMNRPVGPNIFRTTCNELVACLLYGKNARRAIEMPVVIIEDLLQLAVASTIWRDLYLELADVVATAAVTQSVGKLEWDQRDRNRRRQEEKRGETPSNPPLDLSSQLDPDAVLYAKRLQEQIVTIRRELTAIPAVPVARDHVAAESFLAFAKYLQSLIAVADRASYTAFTAFLQSTLGGLLAASNPQSATVYYREAANRFVSLATEERNLMFTKLSARHLSRAAELFAALGDQAAAQQCRARVNGV